MESNFNKREEFEHFVQQHADQYRMFPSEKVWKNVHNALHTRRRWYGAGLAVLLLTTVTAVTWVMMSYPVSKKHNIVSALHIEKTPQPASTTSVEDLQQVISFDLPNNPEHPEQKKENNNLATPADTETTTRMNIPEMAIAHTLAVAGKDLKIIADKKQFFPSSSYIDKNKFNTPGAPVSPVNDLLLVNESKQKSQVTQPRNAQEAPLTIESVTNEFQIKRSGKKLSWQLFFSPTVSYRKLSENKYYQDFVAPGSYPFSTSPTETVNNAVTHKPDMGLEIGLTARYPVSKTINFRTGIQFNIRRYDIKAFAYRGELANIDLTGAAGTTTAWTYYRTKNGYKADWLKNFYLTVSVPIGAEVKLFGNKNTSVGIAGTVQPTYILSDRAYLISTDYKNYAEVPSLIRHVNVNTSFETFINYKTGKTQWQVGPQVRYQLLSSFQNQYPVRENLFDFGLKIGVTLNNH